MEEVVLGKVVLGKGMWLRGISGNNNDIRRKVN